MNYDDIIDWSKITFAELTPEDIKRMDDLATDVLFKREILGTPAMDYSNRVFPISSNNPEEFADKVKRLRDNLSRPELPLANEGDWVLDVKMDDHSETYKHLSEWVNRINSEPIMMPVPMHEDDSDAIRMAMASRQLFMSPVGVHPMQISFELQMKDDTFMDKIKNIFKYIFSNIKEKIITYRTKSRLGLSFYINKD